MTSQSQNLVYYGDNLDVLKLHIKDETIDLIYLDPPFNSNTTYNVLFAEKNGSQAAGQIKAFEDTWHWDQTTEASLLEVVETGGKEIDYPPIGANVTFKRAPKAEADEEEASKLTFIK